MPALATASASRGTESSASEAWPILPGIRSAGTPAASSSPAWRLRLAGARTVAVRSPTPARPVERLDAAAAVLGPKSTHSRQIRAAAIPAAFSPWGEAAAAASAAAFLATPAISTPTTSSVRSQIRPARSKTSPSWARRSAS